MSWTGQIFWLLAFGPADAEHTFFPPSPFFRGGPERFRGTTKDRRRHACLYNDWLMGSRIQLQQRNCSRFARDFLRRSTV
jgi:hypothetical protein